jgi:hypothetical protein
MSGGTLAPGNPANPTGTLNISGNLAFQSGALYVVQVTPIAASSTSVSGTATLTAARSMRSSPPAAICRGNTSL